MKKMWISALLAAAMMTAAGAADAPSAWAQKSVDAARAAGLVPSQVDSAFDTAITREDFCSLAAAVYRAWDRENVLQAASTGKVSFTDTDNADVLLCASAGVVNGGGNGKFAPDNNITRQEAASMLHRLGALNKNVKNDVNDRLPHVFADGEKIRSWARSDINWVYRQGIMNGTGSNHFTPDGAYTREQSIATTLRLYDTKYAEVPSKTAAKYTVVVDSDDGFNVQMHLEDAKGNKLLTNYKKYNGDFTAITVFGEWVYLYREDSREYTVYNMKTGETLENYALATVDGEQVGWAIPMNIDSITYGKDYMIFTDGTKATQTYDHLTNFKDGKAVVRVDSKTIRAIDTAGKTVWSMNFALDHKKMYLSDNIGDRFVATTDDDTSYTIIAGGKRIASSSLPLKVSQYSDTYIHMESVGYYALYNFKGKKLTKTYQNALYSEGSNLYAGWVKDRTYEIFYCPAGGSAKVLYTVTWDVSTPTELPTDGAGLYALQTDDRTVVCIDSFGQTVGTAKAAFKVSNVAFEDGVLVLQGENQQVKCLPTGEVIS